MPRHGSSNAELFEAQNRKLDILLVVAGLTGGSVLYDNGHHLAAFVVTGVVVLELLQQWGGFVGLVAAPVLAVRWLYMRLTKRQLRNRTVYKVGGEEFVAQPITRSVQEYLVSMVPDDAFEQQNPSLAAIMGMPGAPSDAHDIRRAWMSSIESTYEQLAYLLVRKDNPDPYADGAHPEVDWLGRVCPVARAASLLSEIQERARIEDTLPA